MTGLPAYRPELDSFRAYAVVLGAGAIATVEARPPLDAGVVERAAQQDRFGDEHRDEGEDEHVVHWSLEHDVTGWHHRVELLEITG